MACSPAHVRWVVTPRLLHRHRRACANPVKSRTTAVTRAGPGGDNPFANLQALRGKLPDKPELAVNDDGDSQRNKGASIGDEGRMSMEEAIAEAGKGSMRAERKAKGGGGASSSASDKPPKPGSIGSGTGSSRGLPIAKQQVRVGVTRAGKKGKSVTCVDGMDVGTPEEAKDQVKKFKKVLGVGGVSMDNGSLQFQGDNAAVLCEMLVAMGYKSTKQTGGVVVKRSK